MYTLPILTPSSAKIHCQYDAFVLTSVTRLGETSPFKKICSTNFPIFAKTSILILFVMSSKFIQNI
jgi:hypothetical protein